MENFLAIAVENYKELAAKAGWTEGLRKNCATPWLDTKEDPETEPEPGPKQAPAA